MWNIIGTIIAIAIGAAAKHWHVERQWSEVRKVAKDIITDPEETNNAKEAARQAFEQVFKQQMDRIQREASATLTEFDKVPK